MVPVVLHHRIAHVHAFTDGLTAPERARRSTPTAATRPSRVGKKGMLIHIDPELSRRLKHLAVDEDKTLQ